MCVGDNYYRICAPDIDDKRMHSCILWTKDDKADVLPTWAKVVFIETQVKNSYSPAAQIGGMIYNADKLKTSFSVTDKALAFKHKAGVAAVL